MASGGRAEMLDRRGLHVGVWIEDTVGCFQLGILLCSAAQPTSYELELD